MKGVINMKFEIGRFYKRTFKNADGEHTEYLYCTDIVNENEGTQYKPFYAVYLHNFEGEAIEIQSDENGYTEARDIEARKYEEVAKEEFALALLDAVISGREWLSDAIKHHNRGKIEKANERASESLPDFGFGGDDE